MNTLEHARLNLNKNSTRLNMCLVPRPQSLKPWQKTTSMWKLHCRAYGNHGEKASHFVLTKHNARYMFGFSMSSVESRRATLILQKLHLGVSTKSICHLISTNPPQYQLPIKHKFETRN